MSSSIDVSDGFRHLFIRNLNSITNIEDKGLRALLAFNDHFIVDSISDDKTFSLQFYKEVDYLECIAADINRMACASLESIYNVGQQTYNKKAQAWNAIEYYYSAFFSVNSLLKILGFGLVQIERIMIDNILSRYQLIQGKTAHLIGGMYCYNLDSSKNTINFYLVNRFNDSHRGVWHRFDDLLGVLCGTKILTNSLDSNYIRNRQPNEAIPDSVYRNLIEPYSSRIVAMLDSIKGLMHQQGDVNWLSTVRNDINYNQKHGVWYPYSDYRPSYEKIIRMRDLFLEDPTNINLFYANSDAPLIRYAGCCQQINAICYQLLKDLVQRNPEGKSFLKNHYFRLVKQINE